MDSMMSKLLKKMVYFILTSGNANSVDAWMMLRWISILLVEMVL